jgi:hypothetical protein
MFGGEVKPGKNLGRKLAKAINALTVPREAIDGHHLAEQIEIMGKP